MNTELRDAIMKSLPCTSRCYPATRGGGHSTGCLASRKKTANSLLPVIGARAAEAWDEGFYKGTLVGDMWDRGAPANPYRAKGER